MRAAIIISLLGSHVLLGCVDRSSGFALERDDVWIRDANVVSLERSNVLEHAHVVVRGDTIAWVGSEAPTGDSSGSSVVDGTGRYLVPGLIDGHVHLATVPGLSTAHVKAMPGVVVEYYRQLPRSYLYFGFTTVVDLNVTDSARIDSLRSADLTPTIMSCGNALVLANGYPMRNRPWPARFERYPNFLYDPRQADSIPARYRAEDHSPAAAVARVVSGGGVCIKSFYEGGWASSGWPVPTIDQTRQVKDEAHKRGIPLLLHANSLAAHRFAATVGVDAVVHGLWNWSESDSIPNELPAAARAVLDSSRQAGVGYMPSLRVISALGDLFRPAFLDDARLAHVVPPALLAWFRTPDAQWYTKEQNPGKLPNERMLAIFGPWRRLGTTYLAKQGAPFLFGSDTPSDQIYTNPPGLSGYLELREMEEAGVSPREILAAATINNAKLFKIDDDYGTIEAGKVASLLLLRENPLASTSAFDTIELLLVRGRVVPRQALSAKELR